MKLRQQALQKGQFDSVGNLLLEPTDIKLIQNYFYLFYLNKLHFERQMRQSEHVQQQDLFYGQMKVRSQNKSIENIGEQMRMDERAMSAHNLRTEKMAANYREKMRDFIRSNNQEAQCMSNIDLSVKQRETKKKLNEQSKDLVKDKELFECSFRPEINRNYTPSKMRQLAYEQ